MPRTSSPTIAISAASPSASQCVPWSASTPMTNTRISIPRCTSIAAPYSGVSGLCHLRSHRYAGQSPALVSLSVCSTGCGLTEHDKKARRERAVATLREDDGEIGTVDSEAGRAGAAVAAAAGHREIRGPRSNSDVLGANPTGELMQPARRCSSRSRHRLAPMFHSRSKDPCSCEAGGQQ